MGGRASREVKTGMSKRASGGRRFRVPALGESISVGGIVAGRERQGESVS